MSGPGPAEGGDGGGVGAPPAPDQGPEREIAGPRQPLFLARQNYRRRRLRDAARFYPFLAAFLFLLPVLWGAGGRATAGDGIYLLSAWAALILGAMLMARALDRPDPAPPEGKGGETAAERAAPPAEGGE